jgi:hypothetical protein
MNLGTHMPNGERRKPIDIEVCRSKALSNKKISNAPKVRKQSCEHMDGQCL